MKEKFSNLLLTSLSKFNVLVWNFNYPFSSYIGSKLLAFIENTVKIKELLVENFVETRLLKIYITGYLYEKNHSISNNY